MAKRLAPLAENYDIKIDKEVFNDAYLPYLYTLNRFEIYYGGAGSGKSVFIAQKLALQLSTQEGRNLIALRHQEKDCKDSCYPQLLKALEQLHLLDLWQVRENPSPRLINRVNGNEIAFTGLDDVENVKSVTFKKGNVTDFWVEEATEIEKVEDIRELNRRLRGLGPKKRVIVSFNPISRTHWLYKFVTSEIKTKNHIALKTTYKDNKFLSKEDIEELESLQYSSPYEYMVYALGEWGTMGQTVFNANAIHSRLIELQAKHHDNPPTMIDFTFERDANGQPLTNTFQPFNNPDGETKIFAMPNNRHPYVLAFDTAGEGADYYAAHVIDNTTGEQVAVFHSQKMPDECVPQIFGLAKYYNNALVCPEVNFDSYPLKKLQEMGYTHFYQRKQAVDNYHVGNEQKLGFRTTAENRQRVLSELVDWANKNMFLLNDPDTLNEMLTFTRQQKKLKGIWWGAENGAHDDLVMSLAIALQAREQQDCTILPEPVKHDGFYLPVELDLMVKDGRITRAEKKQLEDTNHVIVRQKAFGTQPKSRKGRYVR